MNVIRNIQKLNEAELEKAIPPEGSWHVDYRDTAYIYIGGLPFELSEGDIITIFSQYGEPVFINLVRDKETGKSKGFCFLKYEDQRSCDLAVDNLSGAEVLGRILRVDHTRYKPREGEFLGDNTMGDQKPVKDEDGTETEDEQETRTRKKRRTRTESESEGDRRLIRDSDRDRRHRRDREGSDGERRYRRNRKDESDSAREHRHRRHRDDADRERRYRRDSADSDGDTRYLRNRENRLRTRR